MVAAQEKISRELLPELPQTKLGELVVPRAWKAFITGKKTLLIKQGEIKSYHSDIEDILQFCGYSGTDLVRGRKLSKKLHRNLASAVQEILYHNPQLRGRLFLIQKETRGIPARFISISLKRRAHPKDPNVDCERN